MTAHTGEVESTCPSRAEIARLGQRLEYFTIAWNSLEGLIALGLGLLAGSVALVGVGLDSTIEVSSGAALLWRLGQYTYCGGDRAERMTLKTVGWSFIALALYIAYDSLISLIARQQPERSVPGIVLALAALVVMPLLGRAKRRVAREIGSGALKADARQTEFCAHLSAILVGGLALNALLGWWLADPAAGLFMVSDYCPRRHPRLQGRHNRDC